MRLSFAAVGTSLFISIQPATAHFAMSRPPVPNHVETVACRMVKQTVAGVVTTRRVCDNAPASNANCQEVTKRIVKAGGEVVVKTRRVCG
jgi:hypothetical protein